MTYIINYPNLNLATSKRLHLEYKTKDIIFFIMTHTIFYPNLNLATLITDYNPTVLLTIGRMFIYNITTIQGLNMFIQ